MAYGLSKIGGLQWLLPPLPLLFPPFPVFDVTVMAIVPLSDAVYSTLSVTLTSTLTVPLPVGL